MTPRFPTLAEWTEYYEERAAIGEYERGMSRADSEREAARLAGPRPREIGSRGRRRS